MAGPLDGVTVIELAGIGPGPFAGMVLADLGARVVRVERPGGNPAAAFGHDTLFRSREAIAVDLRRPEGVEVVLRLVEGADVLVEGNRPGVTERLGVGPQACLDRNPALVYGRMTGWGQEGPLAGRAGHDINYIALTGALDAIGRPDTGPVPPLNLVGDFGGGAMLLVVGVLAALHHARTTGEGQVVDAAMVDGASLLLAMQRSMATQGMWSEQRGTNLLDGGAPFYDVHRTKDGQWVSLGALEPQFYAVLVERLGIADEVGTTHVTPDRWTALRPVIAEAVAGRTREEWDEVFADTDACYAPVLSMREATAHPHAVARDAFVEVDGSVQPAPAPRFSVTPTVAPRSHPSPGAHTARVLRDAGFSDDEVATLLAQGAVAGDGG